ncbi:MAG: LssY C-terminal domain-containing protein [Nocardioidaceae bacterium]
MAGTRPRERPSFVEVFDAVAFAFAGAASTWLALLVLREGMALDWRLVLLLVFWVLVAYLVLPRLHRILTSIYLPSYFIGRTRTSDGLLGDPVNLALRGDEDQLQEVMRTAGWVRADDLSLASGMKIVSTTLRRTSYAEAPVSPLVLFDRPQDLAYQQEVAGNPAKRHHVRFWRCPDGWMLPGGYAVDWLAAGTYDRSVGLSLWTFQVTHRIEQEVDIERDFIVDSMLGASPLVSVHRIENFSTGYHSRNGGGDRIVTDGDLPVLDLTRVVAAPQVTQPPLPVVLRAPAPTFFGAAVAAVRGVVALLVALAVALAPETSSFVGRDATRVVAVSTAAGFAIAGAVDLWLAWSVVKARNWARMLLLLESAILIGDAFVSDVTGGPRPSLGSGLSEVTLSILVMLALSSRRSREYAHIRPVRPTRPARRRRSPRLRRGRVPDRRSSARSPRRA